MTEKCPRCGEGRVEEAYFSAYINPIHGKTRRVKLCMLVDCSYMADWNWDDEVWEDVSIRPKVEEV